MPSLGPLSLPCPRPLLTRWLYIVCKQVDRAVKTHRQRIKTSLLNEVLSDALMWQKPPAVKASQIGRIYYCNQVTAPSFSTNRCINI